MTYIYLRSARSLATTRLFAMLCRIFTFSALTVMQTIYTNAKIFFSVTGWPARRTDLQYGPEATDLSLRLRASFSARSISWACSSSSMRDIAARNRALDEQLRGTATSAPLPQGRSTRRTSPASRSAGGQGRDGGAAAAAVAAPSVTTAGNSKRWRCRKPRIRAKRTLRCAAPSPVKPCAPEIQSRRLPQSNPRPPRCRSSHVPPPPTPSLLRRRRRKNRAQHRQSRGNQEGQGHASRRATTRTTNSSSQTSARADQTRLPQQRRGTPPERRKPASHPQRIRRRSDTG